MHIRELNYEEWNEAKKENGKTMKGSNNQPSRPVFQPMRDEQNIAFCINEKTHNFLKFN